MNIKVCGITTKKQLEQLDGLDIEFAGLNFFKGSPRYIRKKILPQEVADIDLDIKKTGVFVNAGYDEIMQFTQLYNLDLVQLHGDETPRLCEQLSEELEVIKVFRLGENDKRSIDEEIVDYDDVCDYYLFDTASESQYGGTGKKFDWERIKTSKIEKPFFISGGIGPDDVGIIKSFKHPDFYGIDINSGFETAPGVKDMGLILRFIHALKPRGKK